MAISHADHDHPNTPAARAKCRKANDAGGTTHHSYVAPSAERALAEAAGLVKPPKMVVVPRKRGDGGVVRGMKATAPKAAVNRLKVSGSKIKAVGDLADVPAVLATGVRMAWKLEWEVVAGHPFNDDERRIVVFGPVAELSMVWNSEGQIGFFVRNNDSSVTFRVDNAAEAFEIVADPKRWTANGNLGKYGKAVN